MIIITIGGFGESIQYYYIWNKGKITLVTSTVSVKRDLNGKGKYATSTENRRLVWEYIIWPLILELNRSYFTPKEYHKMRDKVSIEKSISISKMTGGTASLLVKEILTQDKKYHSIHHKLIPYMRKMVNNLHTYPWCSNSNCFINLQFRNARYKK